MEAFDKAGVVHMDLRHENLLLDVSVAELSLVVMDWDDAFLAWEVVPAHLVRRAGAGTQSKE